MTRIKTAVLLPDGVQFSHHYAGACARWAYEIYRRTSSHLDAEVLSAATPAETRYALAHRPVGGAWYRRILTRVPYIRRYDTLLWLRNAMPAIRHMDVVHLINRPHVAPLLRQLRYRGKIVGHLQNDHLGLWPARDLDELASHLDCIVSCSQYIAKTFCGRSSAMAAKSRVIYNGVDRQTFRPVPSRRVSKRLFFVGRFDPQKGVLPLVRAFGEVATKYGDAELVIGGATGFGTIRKPIMFGRYEILPGVFGLG